MSDPGSPPGRLDARPARLQVVSTFITRLEGSPKGLTVAVKDLIDVEGVPTTAGNPLVAERARPAPQDAACLEAIRRRCAAGELRIVGKANLHELALGVTGVNPWFGTPTNPLDARLVPGGSSSGSAVAAATGEAEVAIGTDSGGSIRIPAACCGIAGLKTTWGRIPLQGVLPLAPSLDTVGPMAAGVEGLSTGMELLEPGFAESPGEPARRIGRLRPPCNPEIERSIDSALSASGVEVVDVEVPGWPSAETAASTILVSEAAQVHSKLLRAEAGVGEDVRQRLEAGLKVGPGELARARSVARAWTAELAGVFRSVDVLATPTLVDFPPRLEEAEAVFGIRFTLPVNLAGVPALAMPVPAGRLPASLQLVGPSMGEAMLLATASSIASTLAGPGHPS